MLNDIIFVVNNKNVSVNGKPVALASHGPNFELESSYASSRGSFLYPICRVFPPWYHGKNLRGMRCLFFASPEQLTPNLLKIQIHDNILIINIVESLCNTCANAINMCMDEKNFLEICYGLLCMSVIITWRVVR